MGSRWIKQRDLHSCGPVALMNLQKWIGHPVTYASDFHYWKKKCKCNHDGSPLDAFVNSLYSIKDIKISPRSIPSLETIDSALQQGKAVVMKSAFMGKKELDGHYFLVTERSPRHFFCVNTNFQHEWVSKASFKAQWLQNYLYYCDECGVAPYAWIVRKI